MPTPAASAELHRAHFERMLDDPARRAHTETWLREGTVDAWRHDRMYRLLDPLLAARPGAEWLTIGDGRYGTDAHFLQSRGARAHATDLTDALLREGEARGFIASFSAENAEALSFGEDRFDFVLCKEALHHFPRPMLGFYEMLRCARRGLVLLEPVDRPAAPTLRSVFWQTLRRALLDRRARWAERLAFLLPAPEPLRWTDGYEDINYIYRLAERDVVRAALALGLPAVAFRGLNDQHFPGAETARAEEGDALFTKVRQKIARRDLLARAGVIAPDILAAIVWKEMPAPELRATLEREGWEVLMLAQNPHLAGH